MQLFTGPMVAAQESPEKSETVTHAWDVQCFYHPLHVHVLSILASKISEGSWENTGASYASDRLISSNSSSLRCIVYI